MKETGKNDEFRIQTDSFPSSKAFLDKVQAELPSALAWFLEKEAKFETVFEKATKEKATPEWSSNFEKAEWLGPFTMKKMRRMTPELSYPKLETGFLSQPFYLRKTASLEFSFSTSAS